MRNLIRSGTHPFGERRVVDQHPRARVAEDVRDLRRCEPRVHRDEHGTQLRRAPNDVGGLLDTSKGWTLDIPAPTDSAAAAARIAQTQAAAPQIDAAAQTRVIASR